MSTMQSGSFADLMTRDVKNAFVQGFKEWKPIFREVFPVESSEEEYERNSSVAGFGIAPEKAELVAMTEDNFEQLYDSTITHRTYGFKASVSEEAIDDERHRVFKQIPKLMLRAHRERFEKLGADILNNGFSESYLQADNEPLFGDASTYLHPARPSGGTWRNRLATNADLSVTSLNQMIVDMKNQTDARGLHINLLPKSLLVPVELEQTAWELIQPGGKPGTADNERNFLATQGLRIIVWPFLTDTDAFFLLSEVEFSDRYGLRYYIRKNPKVVDRIEESPMALSFYSSSRISAGSDHAYGVFGSPGA